MLSQVFFGACERVARGHWWEDLWQPYLLAIPVDIYMNAFGGHVVALFALGIVVEADHSGPSIVEAILQLHNEARHVPVVVAVPNPSPCSIGERRGELAVVLPWDVRHSSSQTASWSSS